MRRAIFATVLLASVGTMALEAQTIFTPVMKSPYTAFKRSELGGYISDPGEGTSIALQGEYRLARRKFDLGFVLGYADAKGNGENLFGIGVDARAGIARHTQDFPLDAAVTGGFGVLIADGKSGFLVPMGATLGRQVLLEESNVSFTPYVHPVIIPTFGELLDDVQFGIGLGVDVALTKTFDIRVAGSLGDLEGISIGVAWHR
ncbi:MAG: hypothetical protein JNM53_05680 [Gemmatimonadetes bacterium]|nr:hypothetical protein [Gemmatimonadota bacterium]